MPRGRQSKRLRLAQIAALKMFKQSSHDGARNGYSLPQLRSAMAAPFGYKTLGKALDGLPVWVNSHSYIVAWIECYLGVPIEAEAVHDGKMAAAGDEPPEENGNSESEAKDAEGREVDERSEKTSGTTGTVRGSR